MSLAQFFRDLTNAIACVQHAELCDYVRNLFADPLDQDLVCQRVLGAIMVLQADEGDFAMSFGSGALPGDVLAGFLLLAVFHQKLDIYYETIKE